MEYIMKKIKEILSSKIWQEPETVMFSQLKPMRKLLTDYSLLWLIPEASLKQS